MTELLEAPSTPDVSVTPETTDAPATPALPPAEQTRAVVDQFMAALRPVKAEKAKAKAEPKAAPKPEPVAEVAPEPEPEAKAAPAAVDSEQIAKAVGREVGRVLNEAKPATAAAPSQPSGPVLPVAEQRRQNHMAALEQLFPEEYAGIAKERATFLDKQLKLEQKWLAENPGKEFDPDATEHDEFFASDPMQRVSAEHLAEAIAEQKVSAERTRNEARIRESETRAQVLPRAEQEGARQASAVASSIGGKAAAGLVNADGTVNEEKLKEFAETEPVSAPVIAQAAVAAARLSKEVVKLFNGAVQPDIEGNRLHRQIAEFGAGVEQRMAELPVGQWQDARGRKQDDFLPSRQYHTLPAQQRAKHWTFDEKDMVELMTLELREDAKRIIAEQEKALESVAKRRGYTLPDATKESKAANSQTATAPLPAATAPASPASSAPPRMAGVKGSAEQEAKRKLDAVWNVMWPR